MSKCGNPRQSLIPLSCKSIYMKFCQEIPSMDGARMLGILHEDLCFDVITSFFTGYILAVGRVRCETAQVAVVTSRQGVPYDVRHRKARRHCLGGVTYCATGKRYSFAVQIAQCCAWRHCYGGVTHYTTWVRLSSSSCNVDVMISLLYAYMTLSRH